MPGLLRRAASRAAWLRAVRPRGLRGGAVAGLVVLAVLVTCGLPALGAAGAPAVPPASAADVLDRARTAPGRPVSGSVHLHVDLGLPDLTDAVTRRPADTDGQGTDAASPLHLLAGDHELSVWTDGGTQARAEFRRWPAVYELLRRGDDLWSYDSGRDVSGHTVLTGPAAQPQAIPLDPVQFARRVLDLLVVHATPTLGAPLRVAGRPCYRLVLMPRRSQSLIGRISVAVDVATGLPLATTIDPAAGGPAAVSVAFTRLQVGPVPQRTFALPRQARAAAPSAVPPAALGAFGALGPVLSLPQPSGQELPVMGTGWERVAVLPAGALPARLADVLSAAGSPLVVAGIHARLLAGPLLSVLVLDDGRCLVGLVQPQVLTDQVAAP
ncbi:MAG: hypothetical protein JWM48_1890 [Mycobacterium sp.]|jgi:hypothetical protein|nr:hypothetical protein [Mycobacterium sp.]